MAENQKNAEERSKWWMSPSGLFSRGILEKVISLDGYDGIDLMKRAAERGYAPAVAYWALCKLLGYGGTPVDHDGGMALLKTAATQPTVESDYVVGYLFARGEGGVALDSKKGLSYLKRAANGGFARVWVDVAIAESDLGNGAESLDAATRGAEAGDPRAQFLLGGYYVEGTYIPRDRDKGIHWLTLAAQNDPRTSKYAITLAKAYDAADDMPQHKSIAFSWYLAAAKNDDADAMLAVALDLLHGTGVQMDVERALRLLQTLAHSGNSSAQCELGKIYLEGILVERDTERAAELLHEAADAGDPIARAYQSWLTQKRPSTRQVGR